MRERERGEPVAPGVRAACRADARDRLERIESEYRPAPRRDPLPFGPRDHDPDEPPAGVEGQHDLLAGIGGVVLVDDRPATEEETGLDVELTGLFYTRLVEHRYAAGGTLTVPMAVFRARSVGGSLADREERFLPDGRLELDAVDWFPVDDLPPETLDRAWLVGAFGD